jgi:hypothetical protein
MKTKVSHRERFWALVQRGTERECWPYQGPTDFGNMGYGRFCADGRRQYAHRCAWEYTYGPIPEGAWVLHRCDNPKCCNPRDLFIGTPADNAKDRHAKGRDACGAANGSRRYPERLRRGDQHPFRLHPEKVARGPRGPEPNKQGEMNGRAKLTAADVLDIRRCLKAGQSQSSLARRFGVSHPTIAAAGRGKTWTCVSYPQVNLGGLHLENSDDLSWEPSPRCSRRADWAARAFRLATGPSLKESLLRALPTREACAGRTSGGLPSSPDLRPELGLPRECLWPGVCSLSEGPIPPPAKAGGPPWRRARRPFSVRAPDE